MQNTRLASKFGALVACPVSDVDAISFKTPNYKIPITNRRANKEGFWIGCGVRGNFILV